MAVWQWVGTLHSEIPAAKPRLAHRCSPAIGSAPWPEFCPLWSNHWKLKVCAGSCAVQASWGGAGSLPAEVGGEEGLRWRQWQQRLCAWVSFCFPTSPPKGIRDSLWLQPQPVWHFLASHTFLLLTHLSFTVPELPAPKLLWLQQELGSSRQECPSVDKGLHFPGHTRVFFFSDFLTSAGGVLLTPDLSKYIYTLWKGLSFFHTFLWFLPVWILWFYRYKVVFFQMDPNLHTHTWFAHSEKTCLSARIVDSWVNQVLSKLP